jgi:hypothetical protein
LVLHWWWWLFHERHKRHHRHHHPHGPPGHHFYVLFKIDCVSFLLKPDEEKILMTDITLGQGLNLAISFLDQDGNQMTATPVPDGTPIWTNTTPVTEALSISSDGLSAKTTSVVVGTDTVSVSVTVGGATFSADLNVNVAPKPQTLTSIVIVATPTTLSV